ncbi:MAG TPA: hypothetical protein VFI27_19635 [candidate division Zixibacteria bacterium]|nr:hypothetical protein [candidate division Zixibacteria bacterium]
MRYECITINVTAGGYRVEVACTDPSVLAWIENEIQIDRPYCSLASESQLSCKFDIVNYEPLEVGWWLVKKLCEQGWEPFGVVNWEEAWGLEFISLKKSVP